MAGTARQDRGAGHQIIDLGVCFRHETVDGGAVPVKTKWMLAAVVKPALRLP